MTARCKYCEADSMVKDSRTVVASGVIRRRRHCVACTYRWTTYEIVLDDPEMLHDMQGQVDKLKGMISALNSTVTALTDSGGAAEERGRVRDVRRRLAGQG